MIKSTVEIGSLGASLCLAQLLFALAMGCAVSQRRVEAEERLFNDIASHRGEVDEAMKSRIIRYRFVRVNFHVIARGKETYQESAKAGSTLQLNLFEDAIFRAVLDRREVRSDRRFTWLGHIEGIENSQVTLVVEDGVMAGNIILRHTQYQVRYAGEGTHVIYQIDPKAFPPESDPVVPQGRK